MTQAVPFTAAARRLALCALVLLLAAAPAADAAKVLVDRGAPPPAGAVPLVDYGAFALYDLAGAAPETLPAGVTRLDERLLFEAQALDPRRDSVLTLPGLDAPEAAGPGVQLVQFIGPIREEWLARVRATGARPIHYVANQGYLVWADAAARQGLDALAAAGDVLQYSGRLAPAFKLGPTLRARLEGRSRAYAADEVVRVVIQMVRHDGHEAAAAEIAALARKVLSPWTPLLDYQNLIAEVRVGDLAALAARGDVVHVGERLPRQLDDEVQNQILAADFNGDQSGPAAPGYLAFLTALGFSTDSADYPIVDVTDDGIGNGTVNSNDPTLHVAGLLANPTRLAYVGNCTDSASGAGVDGHGHINTSIVGGYDGRSGFPFQDAGGYQRGQGVNPFGRMAGTRIFDPGFDQSSCGGSDTGVIQHVWQQGARINTNSWGCGGCAGSYDDSSQAYDVGVRDADLGAAGNQELILVFSAGNDGPSSATVGTPGNGKNMITVGASENQRPSDESGSWTDGCLVGPTGADDAMDVIDFSSRGPAPGNRKKPEVIAPGTHIQGTASTNAGYTGNSVCDQYRPGGQTTFAASSGTSHSTPAVAGVTSLVYWWIENGFAGGLSAPPSPALAKAYLMAHPTYLTGVDANDTLPSNRQGYGMPNLAALFDDEQKYLLDQTHVFDNTGETWTWTGAVADPTQPVRLALAYTDKAGAIGTSPQVNNVDLAAVIDGDSYLGNVFSGTWSTTGGAADAANNYEAIFLPAGTFALVCYNCIQNPIFTLAASPTAQSICAPAAALYDVTVGSVLGFSNDVTLGATGHPAGTTVGFSVNPVTPAGTSVLTISGTGSAAPGDYTIDLSGDSTTGPQHRSLGLTIFDAVPSTPALVAPADGAIDLPRNPTLEWGASTQAVTYLVEVATDVGFTNVVRGTTSTATSWVVSPQLDIVTTYYWRVTPSNACGATPSAVRSFTTANPSILLVDDDDNAPDMQATWISLLGPLAVFDLWDTTAAGGEPTLADLAPYRAVVWFTGDRYCGSSTPCAGPQAAAEAALGQYLDGGRCLLLSGQDYLYDMGGTSHNAPTAFMTAYLGVASPLACVSDGGDYAAVTGENVYAALASMALTYTGVYSDYSDELIVGAGQTVALRGSNSKVGALSKLGATFFTSYLAFGLETLSPENQAAVLQTFQSYCQQNAALFADNFELGDPSRWDEVVD